MKPSLLDEVARGIAELNPLGADDPATDADKHRAQHISAFEEVEAGLSDPKPVSVLKKALSANDPGAFLSPKVSGESFEARRSTEGRESLI